jgi:ATP-dependent RNA helicase RhlE
VNSLEPARTDTAAPVPTTPVHTTPVHRDSFAALGVAPALLRALDEVGHTVPTPIQVSAIPAAIAGRDLLGCAQTGTGKTAAFALPILQRLQLPPAAAKPGPAAPRRIRALILSPTRELAAQIGDTFARYGKFTGLRHTVIYGGVGFGAQISALRRGVDVLVATPGRLADLINQREVNLDRVEVLVLDEADRMLDQGFLPEVRRLLRLMPARAPDPLHPRDRFYEDQTRRGSGGQAAHRRQPLGRGDSRQQVAERP